MKCNNCGFENRDTSKFCIKCGHQIGTQQLEEKQSKQQQQEPVQEKDKMATNQSIVQIQDMSTPVAERTIQPQQTIVFSRKTEMQSSPGIQINNIANHQNVVARNIPASSIPARNIPASSIPARNIPVSNIPVSKTVCVSKDNHIKDNGGRKKVVVVSVSIAAIIVSVATLEAILLLCVF